MPDVAEAETFDFLVNAALLTLSPALWSGIV
jgi:hypothetical protein